MSEQEQEYEARVHYDVEGRWFGQLWTTDGKYVPGGTTHGETKQEVVDKLQEFVALLKFGIEEYGEVVIPL